MSSVGAGTEAGVAVGAHHLLSPGPGYAPQCEQFRARATWILLHRSGRPRRTGSAGVPGRRPANWRRSPRATENRDLGPRAGFPALGYRPGRLPTSAGKGRRPPGEVAPAGASTDRSPQGRPRTRRHPAQPLPPAGAGASSPASSAADAAGVPPFGKGCRLRPSTPPLLPSRDRQCLRAGSFGSLEGLAAPARTPRHPPGRGVPKPRARARQPIHRDL